MIMTHYRYYMYYITITDTMFILMYRLVCSKPPTSAAPVVEPPTHYRRMRMASCLSGSLLFRGGIPAGGKWPRVRIVELESIVIRI